MDRTKLTSTKSAPIPIANQPIDYSVDDSRARPRANTEQLGTRPDQGLKDPKDFSFRSVFFETGTMIPGAVNLPPIPVTSAPQPIQNSANFSETGTIIPGAVNLPPVPVASALPPVQNSANPGEQSEQYFRSRISRDRSESNASNQHSAPKFTPLVPRGRSESNSSKPKSLLTAQLAQMNLGEKQETQPVQPDLNFESLFENAKSERESLDDDKPSSPSDAKILGNLAQNTNRTTGK